HELGAGMAGTRARRRGASTVGWDVHLVRRCASDRRPAGGPRRAVAPANRGPLGRQIAARAGARLRLERVAGPTDERIAAKFRRTFRTSPFPPASLTVHESSSGKG